MPNRKKRVVIYGGTELVPQIAAFVTRLADALLRKEDIFLATGGFRGKSDDRGGPVSTDVSVRDGARAFALRTGEPLPSCLETWLPEPAKDRVDVDPDRFHEGKIQELPGFSAQARRVKLVQSADALVTVHGVVRTMLMLEMALVIGRPAVPLPFTGGDSADHWRDNRPHYLARLGLSENQAQAWESFRFGDATAESAVIDDVVSVVNRVVGRKCLILMPFSDSDTSSTRLANMFTARAEQADGGTEVEPETPTNPAHADLRPRLMRALSAGKDQFPEQAARAQADYDHAAAGASGPRDTGLRR